MEDDKQYKKTLRLIVVAFLLGLTILLAFAAWFSIQLTTVQNSINSKTVTVVNGKDGKSGTTIIGPIGDIGPRGYTGEQGPKGDKGDTGAFGSNGTDGASIVGPQGEKGDKGDQGLNGNDGREIEFCRLPNNSLGQRYKGDTACNEIPQPNEPTQIEGETVQWGA